ncbi:MAG: Holliday junction resolvase RuvX, partial [Bradymonadaceae bacterium]
MTTAIGIDVGSQRVGISLSDDSGSVATAHETLDASDARALMEEICDLIERRSVELIVVGWPLHMDGSEGRATEAV